MDSIDLAAVAALASGPGPIWTQQTDDLNVNVIAFEAGQGIGEHVNGEVDVLIVVVTGQGTVTVDGRDHALTGGRALIIPKGARRAIRSSDERFVYLSCHRRRAGLMPGPGRPAGWEDR